MEKRLTTFSPCNRGEKFEVPYDTLVVFSTKLPPQ